MPYVSKDADGFILKHMNVEYEYVKLNFYTVCIYEVQTVLLYGEIHLIKYRY